MFGIVRDDVEAYALQHTTPLPPLLEELKKETHQCMESPEMISDQLVGSLLQCLIYVSGAKNVLELGMFTGFSALMMAHALPDDGKVITCDVNPKAEEVARRYFGKTPGGNKIEIRMGPAIETLKSLAGPFDLVFIDADKENYINYYERCLDLLSPRGIIVVDNTLWSGKVLDPQADSDRAIADFNRRVRNDDRVDNVLLTVRDGLMLIRKR